MRRIKPAVRTETLFGNCLPLQFLYGQCVFFSTDRMEERKRITGSVCLEMWSRDTTRLLLHCKGEGFYFRTAFACPRKSCPKNHPSIGCMQCTLLCTQGACILIRAKKSSAGRFFCPALHSIIYYSLYFLLPAHASALFSARPLLGFPAQSSVPQANPAFPLWSRGTLHRSFSFVPEALNTLCSAR